MSRTRTHVRHGVFETNSSSSHSLTVRNGDLAPMPFPENMLREGAIVLSPGSFNWEWKRYYSALGKASYLLTQAAAGAIEKEIQDRNDRGEFASRETDQATTLLLCRENPHVAMLRRVIEGSTGCEMVIEVGTDPFIGIDHESVGLGMDLFKDEQKLTNFLFDPTSYIETSNDNSKPPSRIECDDGDREPYSQRREPPVPPARPSPRPGRR